MFRSSLRQLSRRYYHPTSSLLTMSKTFTPKDWRIIETSPSGLERSFVNDKTGESTWYTPPGMTAAEILAIPGAKKYWGSIGDVERYMKKMAEEKAKYGGLDMDSPAT